MISNLIRKLFFITLVTVTIPIILGLVVFFWVVGFAVTILANILSWLSGK